MRIFNTNENARKLTWQRYSVWSSALDEEHSRFSTFVLHLRLLYFEALLHSACPAARCFCSLKLSLTFLYTCPPRGSHQILGRNNHTFIFPRLLACTFLGKLISLAFALNAPFVFRPRSTTRQTLHTRLSRSRALALPELDRCWPADRL